MSNSSNTLFLEDIQTNFEEALEKKWYKTARSLIYEVEENGFSHEASEMRRAMNLSMEKHYQPHETSESLIRAEESFIRNASEY